MKRMFCAALLAAAFLTQPPAAVTDRDLAEILDLVRPGTPILIKP